MVTRGDLVRRLTRVVICGLLAAVAFPASALATGSTTSIPFAGFISNPCTGEAAYVTGKTTVTLIRQSDGGTGVLSSSSFNGATTAPTPGIPITDNEEKHQWAFGPDDTTLTMYDYWKINQAGDTGMLPPGDDFYLRTFVEIPVGATGPDPNSLMTLPVEGACR